MTDDYDCHVYLIDGGDEHALIDAGGGRDPDGLIANIRADGLDPRKVRQLLLTHGHADHAAGAAALRERLGLAVLASPTVARYVREGDERAVSLDVARLAGAYPADFAFPACPVERELSEGDVVRVGDLSLEVVDTPGHSSGHVTFVLRGGTVSAFCGDALFWGGKILLQHIWDCSLQESIASVEKLAALSLDALYPGHVSFVLKDARRHVEQAMKSIQGLVPPPQFA